MTTEKNNSKSRIICIGLFVVYAVLTLIGAFRHELWFDEAQAWTIARDNDISGLFEQLHYEGHPPLWYMILFVVSRLGFSCNIMPFISWFFTVIAAAVIMFKSPFSTVTKALLIFSGGFLFFNSVMSRTYCLINIFLVLIAMLFHKRKEHPVIFGTLVALLANTHICVSGFIGAMGLIMLHDIYCDWKTNSAKKNMLNLTGLAIAGIGVLMLVIPLIGSLSSNSITSDMSMTARSVLSALITSLSDTSLMLTGAYLRTEYLLSSTLAILFVILLILMRHKIRPFLILALSFIFYIISSEIIWFSSPHRVHVFVLFFVITIWISETEPQNKCAEIWNKFNPKTESKLVQKLINAIKRADTNFKKSYISVLSVILFCSVPIGAVYLGLDYIKPFTPSKQAAELIRETIPAGSVLVCISDAPSEVAAYLPEYKFYTYQEHDFCTYDTHKNYDETIDYTDEIYNDLKDYENLYMLRLIPDINAVESSRNIVIKTRANISYGGNSAYIEVSTFDAEKEIK